MVRFSLDRDMLRYPMAVDHLMPSGLLRGIGPTPWVSGRFASSSSFNGFGGFSFAIFLFVVVS